MPGTFQVLQRDDLRGAGGLGQRRDQGLCENRPGSPEEGAVRGPEGEVRGSPGQVLRQGRLPI